MCSIGCSTATARHCTRCSVGSTMIVPMMNPTTTTAVPSIPTTRMTHHCTIGKSSRWSTLAAGPIMIGAPANTTRHKARTKCYLFCISMQNITGLPRPGHSVAYVRDSQYHAGTLLGLQRFFVLTRLSQHVDLDLLAQR